MTVALSLTAVVVILTGIVLIPTGSRPVFLSRGEAKTVLKFSKLSYGSRGLQLIRRAVSRQSYGSRAQSYWFLLMRTAVFLSRAESHYSLTAVVRSPTGSY